MGNINYDYIEKYIRNLTPKRTENLENMRKFAENNHIPILEEETEEFIKFLIAVKSPKKILELGTAIGYSAIVFMKSSNSIEKIRTIEIKEDMVNIARKNIDTEKLSEKIEVIHGEAQEVISQLDGKYDVIFVDAAKGQYEKYFNLVLNSN